MTSANPPHYDPGPVFIFNYTLVWETGFDNPQLDVKLSLSSYNLVVGVHRQLYCTIYNSIIVIICYIRHSWSCRLFKWERSALKCQVKFYIEKMKLKQRHIRATQANLVMKYVTITRKYDKILYYITIVRLSQLLFGKLTKICHTNN